MRFERPALKRFDLRDGADATPHVSVTMDVLPYNKGIVIVDSIDHGLVKTSPIKPNAVGHQTKVEVLTMKEERVPLELEMGVPHDDDASAVVLFRIGEDADDRIAARPDDGYGKRRRP